MDFKSIVALWNCARFHQVIDHFKNQFGIAFYIGSRISIQQKLNVFLVGVESQFLKAAAGNFPQFHIFAKVKGRTAGFVQL